MGYRVGLWWTVWPIIEYKPVQDMKSKVEYSYPPLSPGCAWNLNAFRLLGTWTNAFPFEKAALIWVSIIFWKDSWLINWFLTCMILFHPCVRKRFYFIFIPLPCETCLLKLHTYWIFSHSIFFLLDLKATLFNRLVCLQSLTLLTVDNGRPWKIPAMSEKNRINRDKTLWISVDS